VVCTLDYGGGVCSKLLQSKSRQLEPLASPIGLLALVHTTRLTGGCDLLCGRMPHFFFCKIGHSEPPCGYFF
ncbi:MAG: hypothetical protein IJX28_07375, partial [Clostridia bacterium]|nr:hypothetical protein [Clostridia bacterium]